MIDLVGQNDIKTLVEYDEGTGVITLTFKDEPETTTFGTFEIEATRYLAMIAVMKEVGLKVVGDVDPDVIRTIYDENEQKADTEFI